MPKRPPDDLLKRVNEIPDAYRRCRQRGWHNLPLEVDPHSIRRVGRKFEIAMLCQDCETPVIFSRSTTDGSLIPGERRYKYEKDYHMEGTDPVAVRNALWLQTMLRAEELAPEARTEPPIPQPKPRRRKSNGARKTKEV